MNTVFLHDGNCLFSGTWKSVTSSKGLDALILHPPKEATHFCRYTTGATATLTAGETLTGGTSSATCVLVDIVVENGTFAGGDGEGVIFVKTISGTFEAETLTGGSSTGTAAILQDMIALRPGHGSPRALLVAIEVATMKVNVSGVIPSTTALSNQGINLDAGMTRVIRGVSNITNFRAINEVDGNGAILQYDLYF